MLSDCEERAEKGMCLSDIAHTRVKCLRSCEIYQPDEDNKEEETAPEFEFDLETYIKAACTASPRRVGMRSCWESFR